MKDKNIVVLMGGPSAEREVSLNTGKAILAALKEKGYKVVGLELEPGRLGEQLKELDCDIVFNAVHGKYGEDGVLQGALELMGIAYTGSGVLANAMAMDKGVSKQMFIAGGIKSPRAKVFGKKEERASIIARVREEFCLPVVVKACSQGSSIGVTIVEQEAMLEAALQDAFKYSNTVLVEEFIAGRELTVAVLGGDKKEALPIIEIIPHSGKYDYQSKYTKGATEYLVPAAIEEAVAAKIQSMAVQAFTVLGCEGIARVDFILGKDNEPYALEVNTVPGMTATSLVPKAAKAVGIEFADLCERLLLMAGAK